MTSNIQLFTSEVPGYQGYIQDWQGVAGGCWTAALDFSIWPGVLLGRTVWSWLAYREEDALLVVLVQVREVMEVMEVEMGIGNFSIFVNLSSLEPGVRGSSTVQLLWSVNGVTFEFLQSFRDENFGVKIFLSILDLCSRGSMIGSRGMIGICLVAGKGERSHLKA